MRSSMVLLQRIVTASSNEDEEDGDLNEFNPRRNKTQRGLTPPQVKKDLASKGVMFKVGPDEYLVWLKGTKQDDAYSTDDLDDAYDTGLSMAKSRD